MGVKGAEENGEETKEGGPVGNQAAERPHSRKEDGAPDPLNEMADRGLAAEKFPEEDQVKEVEGWVSGIVMGRSEKSRLIRHIQGVANNVSDGIAPEGKVGTRPMKTGDEEEERRPPQDRVPNPAGGATFPCDVIL